jgi:hypothetical protein
MRLGLNLAAVAILAAAAALFAREACAEQRRLALKSDESVELGPVYWVVNCRSIMVGMPVVEILEGPPELTMSIKEASVLPRRQNCAKPVQGGNLFVTAKTIGEAKEAKLTYRIKYKTKDGDRVTSNVYTVSLFP